MMIVLRLIHIGCGVYWAGTMIFYSVMLEPSLRASGPEGGKVLQALMRRGHMTIMPIVAGLTILTGIELMRNASGGFVPEWFSSGPGRGYSIGGLAAILSLGLGLAVTRPLGLRMSALTKQAAVAAEPDRSKLTAELETVGRHMRLGARTVTLLVVIAVVLMAIARYL